MFAPQITTEQVLRTFHSDAPYLFLGAAFVTVGVIAGALAAIRRKHDRLLIYFCFFAVLYGMRLWIQAGLLQLTVQGSAFYPRLRTGVNYLVIVPAFLFMNATGLMTRIGRVAGYVLVVVGTALSVATFSLGPISWFTTINNVAVIGALLVLAVQFMRRAGADRDFIVIRRGMLIFAAGALVDNLVGLRGRSPQIEAYGFVALLASLGYVAARRALQRDQQLGEIQKELEVAKRIQLSILPSGFPSSAHFQVAARYVPMTSVAGDF